MRRRPHETDRARAAVLGLVGLGVVGALVMRAQRSEPATSAAPPARGARLVELGSTSCRSCKAMHEELALLRGECSGIAVEEIDVWRDEEAGQRYGVNVIPTQVFLDADGRELDRHTGFLARADARGEPPRRRGARRHRPVPAVNCGAAVGLRPLQGGPTLSLRHRRLRRGARAEVPAVPRRHAAHLLELPEPRDVHGLA
ncbi:MAG: thioredoxin family protein [Myxococcales bacterium]|nr:thioredoxin family protein [Myxococcales bacterium]